MKKTYIITTIIKIPSPLFRGLFLFFKKHNCLVMILLCIKKSSRKNYDK